MTKITEDTIEQDALAFFKSLGYEIAYGPDIAFTGDSPERDPDSNFKDAVLNGRLFSALERINPDLPADVIEDAVRKITRPESPSLIENNRAFQKMLTSGIDITWKNEEGEQNDTVRIVDTVNLENNNWLAVNQFTVVENAERRPDIVLFINGLPFVVIELKNLADEKATVKHAFNQLQTYMQDIPSLFVYNALLAISDGMSARAGTLTAGFDRFMPWRTITGDDLYREPGNEKQSEGTVQAGLETVIKGIFNPAWFLDYCLNFITFEDEGGDSDSIAKKAAGYHQYHAVNKAVKRTIEATSETGDKRIGVVWHTQGSGKSLSMAFYAAKLIRNPAMRNPTIIVLTDRNDLDEQLFDTFAFNKDLLGQTAKQSQSRSDLRELLSVAAGGLVFTTIQKFLPEVRGDDHPLLSDRRNIVVIADEAHRSQYGLKARLDQKTGHTLYGLAKYMRDALPEASFIGYSGTPVEKGDVDTQRVFGDYIDTYDILRAVEDGATVPIFFENRLANIKLKESEIPKIDPKFEEITEAEEEESSKQQLRTKWASLEAIVGSPQRLKLVAKDLIEHFEGRQEGMAGKGLIVCMSRRICVELYKEIVTIRPEWDSEDDAEGAIKVVMTGSASDELSFKKHIRPKKARTAIAKRFKNPKDALKLVIVRDMWLTGFDCPSMHTMYIDKPMQGHNLMQAITRVNRVFGDKPGGRVVDYLGLADALKRALRTYTVDGDDDVEPQDQVKATSHAVAVLKSKYEIVTQMLHGFDFAAILKSPPEKRLTGIALAMDFILGLDDGKKRYVQAVAELSKAFALAMPHDDAVAVRDEIALLQAIKASLIKATGSGSGSSVDGMEAAIQQLVARAVTSTEVVDIFEAAGMEKPDISILSPEFLDEVKQLPQKNLAFELLKKLLNDEIKIRMKKNVVKARSFADMLQEAINKYRNRSIASAEVIDELIEIAKEMKEAQKEGEELGLDDDEHAFYDALADNQSAKDKLGDDALKVIAQELVVKVQKSVTIDWTKRENARAQIRVLIKRILRHHKYPPDAQKKATELVLEQAEVLCQHWTVGE